MVAAGVLYWGSIMYRYVLRQSESVPAVLMVWMLRIFSQIPGATRSRVGWLPQGGRKASGDRRSA